MKIAIDCRKYADFGIGTTIRGILEGLMAREDEDLEYLILAPPAIRDVVSPSPRFSFVEEDSAPYSFRELISTGRAAQKHGADLLHVPHYVTPYTSLPVVTTIHDLIHLRLPRRDLPFGGRLYARWMLGRAVKKSSRIVTVSNAVKREIEQQFPRLSPDSIIVVPNGVPEPAASPVDQERRGRYLLFAGNDKPHKNVDRLVKAFESIDPREAGLTLVLAGSEFERFRSIPGVNVRGFVEEDDLIRLYRHATALVQPSLMEGFGLPVAEAMSHGTPVIVSAIPPLLEVAGDAAIPIADPFEVESIATAMKVALYDDERRQRSASLGPVIAQRYRWSAAAEILVELWRDVRGRQ